MNGATEVQFMYRNNEGRLLFNQNQVPLCVLCYNSKIYERDAARIEREFENPKFAPAGMAHIFLEGLSQANATLINPQIHCGAVDVEKQKNQKNHYECATHYYVGLAMLAADRDCRAQVTEKILEQSLTGIIPVTLMRDFNFDSHEWRIAAKYPGHSIDLYTLKLKEDDQEETEFYESDESTIENIIKKFFNK